MFTPCSSAGWGAHSRCRRAAIWRWPSSRSTRLRPRREEVKNGELRHTQSMHWERLSYSVDRSPTRSSMCGMGSSCMRTTRRVFGRFRAATTLLDKAVEVAQDAGMHELVFRSERIRDGLRDCQVGHCSVLTAAAEPAESCASVREISASLAQLGD